MSDVLNAIRSDVLDVERVLSRTCICVIAAGGSSRMGRPKQLAPLAGEPMAHRACRTALEAGAAETCLVTGAYAADVEAAVADLPASAVHNGCWQQGQASSVRLAANFARTCGARWLMVLPADMPLLPARHLRALAAQAAASPQAVVASASPEGAPMAPCLFPETAFPLLDALEGDAGAGAALRRPNVGLQVRTVAFERPEHAADVDTPEQLARMEALLAARELNGKEAA